MLRGGKSGFRAGFRPHSSPEDFNIGPPAGLRPAGEPILRLSKFEARRNPISGPEALLGNMGYVTTPVARVASNGHECKVCGFEMERIELGPETGRYQVRVGGGLQRSIWGADPALTLLSYLAV